MRDVRRFWVAGVVWVFRVARVSRVSGLVGSARSIITF